MRVLCTGDIHLGRPLSQIPAWYPGGPVSSTSAWHAIVDLAITEGVDLVAISGDLVDQSNKYHESIGPIEQGLRALAEAQIPVVAVAGNHDYDTLPRIVDRFPGQISLLGRGGTWERWTLKDDAGTPQLHIDGWSFAREHVTANPADAYALPPSTDVPVIGLLHADLNVSGSSYAPVQQWQLAHLPPSCWILGHIHLPTPLESLGDRPQLYPGSPLPLDPGETGTHGIVMLDISPFGEITLERRPIASVRYMRSQIELQDIVTAVDASHQVEEAISRLLRETVDHIDGSCLELLVVRLTLTGRRPARCQLDDVVRGIVNDFRPPTYGTRNTTIVIEQIADLTRPEIDLDLIASGIDAPAAIARTILALGEEQHADRLALLDEARRRARDVATGRHHRELNEPLPDDAELVAIMERESWRLLNTLISQKDAV